MLQESENWKNTGDFRRYRRTQMQKEKILQILKERGYRITRQRQMLLDIILEEECSNCKEIYFKATRQDPRIGAATVYRMINTLEEIGAINRQNMYRISSGPTENGEEACTIEFDDDTILVLPAPKWNQIIQSGLAACGYSEGKKVRSVISGAMEV